MPTWYVICEHCGRRLRNNFRTLFGAGAALQAHLAKCAKRIALLSPPDPSRDQLALFPAKDEHGQ
jgi:hypothetical protein